MSNARVPPQSLEAEQAVLGAMLLGADAIDVAGAILKPEDFYREAHGLIFRAACSLHQRGEPVDLTILGGELERRAKLEQAGGRHYLSLLMDAVPTAAHCEYYARIVEEKALLRRLIRAGTAIVEECYGELEDVEAAADRAQAGVQACVRPARRKTAFTMEEIVRDAARRYEDATARQEAIPGIPTGFYRLDAMTGGFQPGDMVVLAAETTAGKTAAAAQIAMHAARADTRVLFFSMEMTAAQIGTRMAQMRARVPSEKIRSGTCDDEELERLYAAFGWLSSLPIEVETAPSITVAHMATRARAAENLGLIVVDYLQHMSPPGRSHDRRQDVEAVSRGIKELALELEVPILVLSQLARPGQGRSGTRPTLDRLRESGAIAHDADVVLLLWRDEAMERENPPAYGSVERRIMEFNLAKQRNGRTGVFHQAFLLPYARFEEM